MRELRGHSDRINNVSFVNVKVKLIAISSDDGTVRIWDQLPGGNRNRTLTSLTSRDRDLFKMVAFSHDGKHVASTNHHDFTVFIWDSSTGECKHELQGHLSYIIGLSFSSDTLLLASASEDHTVRVWDPETGECKAMLEGHTSAVTAVIFLKGSGMIASASTDGTVQIWDKWTEDFNPTFEGHTDRVEEMAFSPDGNLLSSASFDGTIRLWDPITGECKHVLKGHDSFSATAFSNDGSLLASGDYNGTVLLWDLTKGLLASQKDGIVRLWDSTTGVCKHTLVGHNGKLLTSCSRDDTTRKWDTRTGKCMQILDICLSHWETNESMLVNFHFQTCSSRSTLWTNL